MNKKKTKTHGTLKNKEAFKATLKQWGLISQAMLQGAENKDCFCDYTPTFSMKCYVSERMKQTGVSPLSLTLCICSCACLGARA